jgi:hypothetical protein
MKIINNIEYIIYRKGMLIDDENKSYYFQEDLEYIGNINCFNFYAEKRVLIRGDEYIQGNQFVGHNQFVEGNQYVAGDQYIMGNQLIKCNQNILGDQTVHGFQSIGKLQFVYGYMNIMNIDMDSPL